VSFYKEQIEHRMNVVFRLKLNTAQSDSSETTEPRTTTAAMSNFNIPLSDYKWNKIDELQLSDNKKVRST
jgi:hypothetical protein